MNFKLSSSKFYSVLMVALFFVGFQSSADAQITIENESDCTIWVAASQLALNTQPPCDACNLVALTRVIPGNSLTVAANASCGFEVWKEVFYSDAPSGGHVATTANPNLNCGGDFGSIDCNGTDISATWSGGFGAVTVTLK